MDWRLFGSTFLLVFLAELGDKTQLTALAASAGAKSPWSVFLGASLALILATLIAVLVGSTLNRLLPEKVLKISAGILFLLFGAILLISNLARKPEPALPSRITLQGGFLTSFVLETACRFEQAAAEDYEKLIQSTTDPHAQALFSTLARQEMEHAQQVRGLIDNLRAGQIVDIPAQGPEQSLACPIGIREFKELSPGITDLLDRAIEHEKLERDFFATLARVIHIQGLKPILQQLSQEEDEHMRELLAMKSSCESVEPA